MSEKFQYSTTFSDNILVVGQTGCGKTNFVQSLGSNKLFGNDLVTVERVSKISLSKSQENEIRQSFNYTYVEFHYPENNEDFSLILETFQKDSYDKEDNNNDNYNIYGEKKHWTSLSSSTTVIYLTKSIWQMILLQTKIFDIFLSSIQLGNMLKVLTNNCDRETIR